MAWVAAIDQVGPTRYDVEYMLWLMRVAYNNRVWIVIEMPSDVSNAPFTACDIHSVWSLFRDPDIGCGDRHERSARIHLVTDWTHHEYISIEDTDAHAIRPFGDAIASPCGHT